MKWCLLLLLLPGLQPGLMHVSSARLALQGAMLDWPLLGLSACLVPVFQFPVGSVWIPKHTNTSSSMSDSCIWS
jgi:hypothetical protein